MTDKREREWKEMPDSERFPTCPEAAYERMLKLNDLQIGVDPVLSHERYLLVLHGHTMEEISSWFRVDNRGFVVSGWGRRRIRIAD